MTRGPDPPRIARRLLERALPPDAQDDISGDLHEVYVRDVHTVGRWRARARYWRKACSFAWHFRRERFGVPRPTVSWLDIKLGLRMLVRYPGLTLVGGLGIAIVIAGGSAVAIFDGLVHATLPFDEGDRIVVLENWDTEWNNQEHRVRFDYPIWRDQLESVEDVGAFRPLSRNLIVGTQAPRLVRVAEMTASGFRMTRVAPVLGRYLVEADERAGAPQVVVIGEEIWQRDFDGASDVVGRTLQLGTAEHTVVGVMPGDYRFPENDQLWVPLRLGSGYAPRIGPVAYVFGRLAPGVDLAGAQAELTTMDQRAAATYPDTHARLRARVTPFARSYFDDMEGFEIPVFRTLVILLLVIIGSNVAVLIYARTTTRRTEIALRTALGASRWRIVGQLFAESLLLSVLAAGAGLVLAQVAVRQADALAERFGAPFWLDPSLASAAVLRDVVGLTVIGACVIGLVPALHATGRRAQAGLQQASAAGAAWRFGRTHTALIVAQVAFAVALMPAAGSIGWMSLRYALADPGFAAHEFLTARLRMDRETTSGVPGGSDEAFGLEFGERLDALIARLEAEPFVAAATTFISVPGGERADWFEVELDGLPQARVSVGRIGIDYFDAFDVPMLSGRGFEPSEVGTPGTVRDLDGDGIPDTGPQARTAIVNESFVRDVLGGRAPLGLRLRIAAPEDAERPVPQRSSERPVLQTDRTDPNPWVDIVGVAADFPAVPMEPGATTAKVYLPIGTGSTGWPRLAVRLRGGAPDAPAEYLRRAAADVDPRLQIRDVLALDELMGQPGVELSFAAWGVGIVAVSVLLQSAAGLYALMSFAVAHRRREIGIRAALGANPARLVAGIFARAFWQLALGIGAGLSVALAFDWLTEGEVTGDVGLVILPIVAAVMLTVGLLAAIGPARRGLSVRPIDVLRDE